MQMKAKNIKDGDIFILNGLEMVAVDDYLSECSVVFITQKEYWNENGVYSYTSGGYKRFEPDQEIEVIGNIHNKE